MNRMFRGLFRRGWLLATFLPLASLQAQTNTNVSLSTPALASPRRPSIILILADNIGFGDLGCYGQTKIKTPNLDKLAGEGMRFYNFYAASPDDLPARAALFTGMEPRHLHPAFNQALPADVKTLPAALKQLGYHTGLLGEWALGDSGSFMPNQKGFDEFAGFLNQAQSRLYFADKIYRQDPLTGFNDLETLLQNADGQRGLFLPDMLASMAVNFARLNAPDKFNHYRAFFLTMAYPLPHPGTLPIDVTYKAEPWPQAAKDRAALITRMDRNIGVVLRQLETMKLDTNTAIIFTSVNGPKNDFNIDPKLFDSTGGLRGQQGSVYEGGIRVPLIVRWPARVKPGQVSDLLCAAQDLLPTAVEIGYGKPPQDVDGISIFPTLVGKKQSHRHESLTWESRSDGLQQAVRMDDWKLVQIGKTNELFNLKTDSAEKTNVADKNRNVVSKLQKLAK